MKANKFFNPSVLTVSISLALIACGGGGGSGVSTNPPVTQPPVSGGPVVPEQPTYSYNPDVFKITPSDTSANKVKVGVIDSGTKLIPELQDSVKAVYGYTIDKDSVEYKELSGADFDYQDISKTNHGTLTSQVIAGKNVNSNPYYQNGIALGVAEIYAARVSDLNGGFGYTTMSPVVMKDLLERHGVKIFNNSYGYFTEQYLNSSAQQLIYGYLDVINQGALVIWSAGNQASDHTTLEAQLPKWLSDLEKGWLAVVGKDYYGSGLATNSNKCGETQRWCIMSDFTRFGLVNPDTGESIGYSGTSSAAPQVSATAALVASKFPWMDMDQVRQVLLTTAEFKDDGSASNGLYNATYGWGYYNPQKALGGIGHIGEFGTFFANIDDKTYVFSNDIHGAGGLSLSGDGVLALTGNNTYTGDTTVENAELVVHGSIGSKTIVGADAVLSGSGMVKDVESGGTVSTERGRLTIAGNLVQQGDESKLAYGVDHQLTVKGTASIDGALTVSANKKEIVKEGEYLVLDSKLLTGVFDSTTATSSFLNVDGTRYTDKEVYVGVKFADAKAAGTIAGGISTPSGDLINQLMVEASSSSADNTALVEYVKNIQQSDNQQTAQSVLNSVSGAMFAETPSVLLKNDTMVNAQISQRNHQVAKNGKSGAWVSYGQVDTEATANGWDKVTSEINSFTVGADVAIAGKGLIGAYATNYKEQSKYLVSQGTSEINLTTLGVYGKLDLNKNVYFSANANYGFGDADFKRVVTDSVKSENSLASADLDKFGVYGEFGYEYLAKQLGLSPYFALSYNSVSMDALKESSDLGVNVNSVTAKETKAHAGLRLEYKASPQLSLVGYGEYAYAVDRSLPMVNLSSNLTNGVSVDYKAPSFDKDYFLYGVGLNFESSDSKWNVFGDLNGNAVNSADQQIQVGLKYNF